MNKEILNDIKDSVERIHKFDKDLEKRNQSSTVGKIIIVHGCQACKNSDRDQFLIEHGRAWCKKSGGTFEWNKAVAIASGCVDWAIVTDKDMRNKFIDEAETQASLPFEADE